MFTRIVGLIVSVFAMAACSSAPPAAITSVTIDQDAFSLVVGETAP